MQVDANDKELTALKVVIKCIEEHKLANQYPVDPLQKRVVHLEKAKADQKRATEVSKPQPKRPRANTLTVGPTPLVIANTIADAKTYHHRHPQHAYNWPYFYPGPADSHGHSILGAPAAAYNMNPAHPHSRQNFSGNCYQYQTAYLH